MYHSQLSLKKSLQKVNSALPEGHSIQEAIDFEVNVTTTTSTGGGVEIKIFNAAKDKEYQQSHKIAFSIVNETEETKKTEATAAAYKKHSVDFLKILNDAGKSNTNNKTAPKKPD